MPLLYGLGGIEEVGMTPENERVYKQLRIERENLVWFHTPPPPAPRSRSREEVELIKRVLEERIQQAKRNWAALVQEVKREQELLSTIPDPEETLWSLEMRERTRMAYRGTNRK